MDEGTGIRRTTYMVLGRPVSLAYIPCIGDEHPEAVPGAPPPPRPDRASHERAPKMTEAAIRRVLGKDRAHSATLKDRVGFEATLSRIAREGF